MRKLLLLTVLALTFTACDSSDSEPGPDPNVLSGTYVGADTFDGDDVTQTLTITIPSTASGAFTITSGTVTEVGPGYQNESSFTGTGTYTPPNITMETDFFLSLDGTVSDDGSQITVVNEDMISYTLTRQ